MTKTEWENNKEIQIFREYLRIPSVHPHVDYTACVEFLKRQASDLGLPLEVVHPQPESNPHVIIKWLGREPELPAIMLNSHMDVVPVYPENWTHEPFGAEMDEEGRIYARGTQDMKCVGTQYLGAIRLLLAAGYQPKRTVYFTYVPDEETDSASAMKSLVNGDYFKKLNIGFSLDEGIASPDDTFSVFYAERTCWDLKIQFSGTSGHGLLLLPHTAGEKFSYVLNKLMEYRDSQVKRLEQDPKLETADVTTINLTQLDGGIQNNIVPPMIEAGFDMRISISEDLVAFEKQIRDWIAEAGGDIEIVFHNKYPAVPPTKVDASNPYWLGFKRALDELGEKTRVRVFPANTDSWYIRQAGIPALGFSPIKNTPVLLHDHNEFLHADTYLRGIEIYKKVIECLANA